jgi:hypothetical protein
MRQKQECGSEGAASDDREPKKRDLGAGIIGHQTGKRGAYGGAATGNHADQTQC